MLLAALLAALVGVASSAEASIPQEEPRGVLLEQPVPLLEQPPLLEVPADEPVTTTATGGESLPLFGPGPRPDGLFDSVRIPALERFQAETRYRVMELEIEIRAELERLQTPKRAEFALFGGGKSPRGSPNRYYDPELGRFISADPLGYVDGPSMYAFSGYSPFDITDPLGLAELFAMSPAEREAFVREHTARQQELAALSPEERAAYLAAQEQANRDAASLTLGCLPLVGDAKDFQEALTGCDLVSHRELTTGEQVATGVATILPIVGGALARKVWNKVSDWIFDIDGDALSEAIGEGVREGVEELTPRFEVPRRAGLADDLVRYNPDFAIGQAARSGNARASQLVELAESNGWARTQTASGPLKYLDENGIVRLTIKRGSPRAPGSALPHIEIRNASGQRIDVFGNPVTRRSPANHTPIVWDLE